jgi:hypothetical protein
MEKFGEKTDTPIGAGFVDGRTGIKRSPVGKRRGSHRRRKRALCELIVRGWWSFRLVSRSCDADLRGDKRENARVPRKRRIESTVIAVGFSFGTAV